ncbi:MAG: GFA family protein [Hyphomonadaceae bacterium]|nr:GFA family protein [Hyphomonadaceae bacterium]
MKAQCQCGGLRAEIIGPLDAVVVCSCVACQQRTGAAFGEGAYAARADIVLSGEAKEFVRPTDAGNTLHQFFCPKCGTTLYYFSSRAPDRIGIAVGCIEGGEKLKPTRSVFETSKHDWLDLGADIPGFVRGRDSARVR